MLAISPNNSYKSRNHYMSFFYYFPPNSLFVGQTDPTRLPNDRYKFIHGRDGVPGRDGRDGVIGSHWTKRRARRTRETWT